MQNNKPLEEMTADELLSFIRDGKKQLEQMQTQTIEGEAVLVN